MSEFGPKKSFTPPVPFGAIPVPSWKRRMTVGGASDFQSRPVILSTQPSLLVFSLSVRDDTPDLEHRRVKWLHGSRPQYKLLDRASARNLVFVKNGFRPAAGSLAELQT
jgi:hypothetical protein